MPVTRCIFLFACLLGLLVVALPGLAQVPAPQSVADTRLHYRSNQAAGSSPEDAINALRANGVAVAVVESMPPGLVLKLHGLAPDLILPLYRPTGAPEQWSSGQLSPELLDEVREGIQQGPYRGIGELNLAGDMVAAWRGSAVLRGLLAVGAAYDVPVVLRADSAPADSILSLCRANPGNRFLLARAGSKLPPAEVGRVLDACPRVWMDLSARDPLHSPANRITGEEGRLLSKWEALILAHPDQIVIGSDAVWPAGQLDVPNEKDGNWGAVGAILDFHRRWASFLPTEVAVAVLRDNARVLFTPDFPVEAAVPIQGD